MSKSTLQIVTTTSGAPLADPVITAPTEDELRGKQLTLQYTRATGGIREVLVFGAMMIKLSEWVVVSARGNNSGTRGPGAKGQGLQAWLKQYAPGISQPSACRFRDIAEGLRQEFKLGPRVDLELLLTVNPDQITDEKLLKKREAMFQFIEGKSQRQLLLGFEKSPMRGGARPKGVPLTPEEKLQAYEDAAREDFFAACSRVESLGARYQLRTPAEVDQYAETLRAALEAVNAWRALPPSKRPKPKAESFFPAEEEKPAKTVKQKGQRK